MISSELVVRLDDAERRPDDAGRTLLEAVRAEPLDPDVEAMVAARERLYPGPLAGLWSILLAVTLVVLLVAGPFAAALMIQPGTGVAPHDARIAGTLSFLFLPPAIVIVGLLFWRYRQRADYIGISKFLCCGMLSVVPVTVAEGILMLLFALALSAYSPLEVWMARLQSLTNDVPLGLETTTDYVVMGFAVVYMSFVVAGFTEETLKFVVALFVRSNRPVARYPYTVVLYVTMGALGFATLENFFYVVQSAARGNIGSVAVNAALRALVSVPMHTVTGLLIGAKMATLPTAPSALPTFKEYLQIIWLPILVHGLFDLIAFTAGGLGGWYQIGYILLPVVLGLSAWKAWKDVSPLLAGPEFPPVASTPSATSDNL